MGYDPYGGTVAGPGPSRTLTDVFREDNAMNRADNFRDIYNTYNAAYGPQMNQLSNQNANYNSRIGSISSAYGQQAALANQGYNNSLAKINLQLESLGPERESLWRGSDYYDKRQGVLNEQTNYNVDLQDRYVGLAQDRTRLQDKAFGLEEGRSDENYQYAQAKAWSDRIAAGGASSPGFRGDLAHLGAEHTYQRGSLTNQRDQYWNALLKEAAGYEATKQNLLWDNQLSQMDTTEQRAKLHDREIQLDYQARMLGLDKDSLGIQLKQGLAKMNLDKAMSVGSLMDNINSNNYQKQQLSSQIFMQALQAAYQ